MDECIFCKIVAGTIPVQRIAEDEHALAFPDINPEAPTHVLIVPKKHIASLTEVSDWDIVGKLHALAVKVAQQKGIAQSGFRTLVNTGYEGGQRVLHLHLHLLGGRRMEWPPG